MISFFIVPWFFMALNFQSSTTNFSDGIFTNTSFFRYICPVMSAIKQKFYLVND
jgi:hypothetical protein